MKVIWHKSISVTIELDESEAIWLKGVVQNPSGVVWEDESQTDKTMRGIFWRALCEAGVKE